VADTAIKDAEDTQTHVSGFPIPPQQQQLETPPTCALHPQPGLVETQADEHPTSVDDVSTSNLSWYTQEVSPNEFPTDILKNDWFNNPIASPSKDFMSKMKTIYVDNMQQSDQSFPIQAQAAILQNSNVNEVGSAGSSSDQSYRTTQQKQQAQEASLPNSDVEEVDSVGFLGLKVGRRIMKKIDDSANRSPLVVPSEWHGLTTELLVAISGHLIGATANMSVTAFNDLVEAKSSKIGLDKHIALRFFDECVAARFIIHSNLIVTKKEPTPATSPGQLASSADNSSSGDTTETEEEEAVEMGSDESIAQQQHDDDVSISSSGFPETSYSFSFGKYKYAFENARYVFQQKKYSQDRDKNRVERSSIRGETLQLVIGLIFYFLNSDITVTIDACLSLGGYSTKSRKLPLQEKPNANSRLSHVNVRPPETKVLFARIMVAVAQYNDRANNSKPNITSKYLQPKDALAWRITQFTSPEVSLKKDHPNKLTGVVNYGTLYNNIKSVKDKVPYTELNCFGSLVDHSNTSTNHHVTTAFTNFFQNGGSGSPFENMNVVGNGKVSYLSHPIQPKEVNSEDSEADAIEQVIGATGASSNSSTDSIPEEGAHNPIDRSTASKTCETGVWVIKDALSRNYIEEILRDVNQLPFLGSSDEVGSNVKSKGRYYRASTSPGSGGLFQLSSDSNLIECDDMQKVESKLVQLVSHLMETQDRLVADSNPTKKMCRWVHEKTMCQMTVGTMKDSAYKKHNDCGFHHNHTIADPSAATSDSEKRRYLSLPPASLMRVVTLVLSTQEGTNARLDFTDAQTGALIFSIETNHNTLHIQNFGCQEYMMHEVFPIAPTTINPDTAGTNNGVRLVFSFRYSIDSRDDKLISELMTDDVRLATCGRRNDYTINKVIDAIETGCLPHQVHPIGPTPTNHPACKNGLNPKPINPTEELMKSGLGDDKPPCLQPDSIPADPISLLEAKNNKTMDIRDPDKLWQRVTSGAFVKRLNQNKIRVRVEYATKYKNKSGKVETKTAVAILGQAPKLPVMVNYPNSNSIEKNEENSNWRCTKGEVSS
jgi:hypothetical protein